MRERCANRRDVASNAMQVVQIRSGRNSRLRETTYGKEAFPATARMNSSRWQSRSMEKNASTGRGIEADASSEAASCRALKEERHPAIRQHGAVVECIGQCDAVCAAPQGIGECIANAMTIASINKVLRNNLTSVIVTIVRERWYGIDQESADTTATRGAWARERPRFCTIA